MYVRVLVLSMLCAVVPRISAAQTVELVYTPALMEDAIALKGSLKGVHVSNALSLIGATPDKKKAYVDQLTRASVVVVLGEHSLTLIADVGFTAPIVLVNASGPTAAKGRIFRIFDKAPPVTAVAVASSAEVTKLMAAAGEIVLKGQTDLTIHMVVGALK